MAILLSLLLATSFNSETCVSLRGRWVGTAAFEASIDRVHYVEVSLVRQLSLTRFLFASRTTTNGVWRVPPSVAMQFTDMRVSFASFTSGRAIILFRPCSARTH